MKLIFVCSPFAGDMEANKSKARKYCRFVMEQGNVPFAPHLLYPQFLDDTDPTERKAGIDMGLMVLESCSELWCFGSDISAGMKVEIEKAGKTLGIPVRRFTADCEVVTSDPA